MCVVCCVCMCVYYTCGMLMHGMRGTLKMCMQIPVEDAGCSAHHLYWLEMETLTEPRTSHFS